MILNWTGPIEDRLLDLGPERDGPHLVIIIIMIITTIIVGGFCIAQIFPSRKLTTLAYTIHANIHTDRNIIHTHTHTHTHTNTHTHTHTRTNTHARTHASTHTRTHTHAHTHRQDLWKCLLKKESFELRSEASVGRNIHFPY